MLEIHMQPFDNNLTQRTKSLFFSFLLFTEVVHDWECLHYITQPIKMPPGTGIEIPRIQKVKNLIYVDKML